MKPSFSLSALAIATAALSPAAAQTQNSTPSPAVAQPSQPDARLLLVTQVSEIAASTTLSADTKRLRIAMVVRAAIAGATNGMSDPVQIYQTAVELVTVAAKAAPYFTEDIAYNVATLSVFVGKPGLREALAEVAAAAAREALAGNVATAAPSSRRAPAAPEFGGNTADTVVSRSR